MPYHAHNLACDHFLADFSDFVDDRLLKVRRAELQAHIDCCEGCLRHLAAYRRGIAVYRAAAVADQDPGVFYARLEHRIWHERGVGGGIIARRTGSWTNHPAWAVAAAAAIVGVFFWAGWQRDAFERGGADVRVPIVVVSRVDDTPAGDVTEAKTADAAPVETAGSVEQPAPVRLASVPVRTPLVREAPAPEKPPARIIFADDPASLRVPQDEVASGFQALEARMDANAWTAPPATSEGWIQPVRRSAMSYAGGSMRSVPINSLVVDAALILP